MIQFGCICVLRIQDNAIAEGRRLTFVECEVEGRLLWVEDTPPQRIRRKQAIPAGMPVGWIARITRMIEDGDCDGMVVCMAGQRAPAPARPPCGITFDTFAGEVDAGRS